MKLAVGRCLWSTYCVQARGNAEGEPYLEDCPFWWKASTAQQQTRALSLEVGF